MRGIAILGVLALACGAPSEERTTVDRADAPLCAFEGEWSNVVLRTRSGGVPFVTVNDVAGRAELARNASALRLDVSVSHEGWELEGMLDPREEDALSVREVTWLHEGVALVPGARPRVTDARAGELLLERTRDVWTEEDGFRFLAPIARWTSCTAIDPGGRPRAGAEALGLARELPVRFLPAGARATLAIQPGGAPFVEIAPRESSIALRVADARGEHTRVVFEEWTGAVMVGWLSSSLLADEELGMGGLGIGGLGGSTREVCASDERLDVFVGDERVGSVAPGTRYVLGARQSDGSLSITPHGSGSLSRANDDVAWIVRPSSPPSCVEETTRPTSIRGTPAAVIELRATVTRASGAIANGTTCVATIEHFPNDELSCRAEIGCGNRVLFGARETNGYFECELTAGASPSIVGEDPQTTSASGDAAIRIDTRAQRLTVDDDASGLAGELHLEARIDSVQAR